MQHLNLKPGTLTLRDVLEIFVAEESEEPRHPFQMVKRIEGKDDKIILEDVGGEETTPILAGVAAGVLERLSAQNPATSLTSDSAAPL